MEIENTTFFATAINVLMAVSTKQFDNRYTTHSRNYPMLKKLQDAGCISGIYVQYPNMAIEFEAHLGRRKGNLDNEILEFFI